MSQKIELVGNIRVQDELTIRHFRGGVLIDEDLDLLDLVTDVGLEFIAKLINGVVTDFFEYMAIGTGTTGPANGDTALEAEITTGGGARASSTTSYEASYKAKWINTFNFTATFAVTEEGILDAATAGNLLARHVFAVKNVENGDSIEFTHKLTVSRAA